MFCFGGKKSEAAYRRWHIESIGFCCLKKLKVYNRVPVSKMCGRLVHSCRDDMIVMYVISQGFKEKRQRQNPISATDHQARSDLYVLAFSHSEVLNFLIQ